MKTQSSKRTLIMFITAVVFLTNTNVSLAMYDPHLGRFTARDPVFGEFEEPLTLHKYLYCLNDPINMTDPEGKDGGLVGGLVIDSKRTAYAIGVLATAYTLVAAINLSHEGLYIATLAAEDTAKTFDFLKLGADTRSLSAELAHPAVTYEDHKRQLASLQQQLREAEKALGNAKGPKRKGPIEELIEKLKKMIKGHKKEMKQKWPDL